MDTMLHQLMESILHQLMDKILHELGWLKHVKTL